MDKKISTAFWEGVQSASTAYSVQGVCPNCFQYVPPLTFLTYTCFVFWWGTHLSSDDCVLGIIDGRHFLGVSRGNAFCNTKVSVCLTCCALNAGVPGEWWVSDLIIYPQDLGFKFTCPSVSLCVRSAWPPACVCAVRFPPPVCVCAVRLSLCMCVCARSTCSRSLCVCVCVCVCVCINFKWLIMHELYLVCYSCQSPFLLKPYNFLHKLSIQ